MRYFITRHAGAKQWAENEALDIDAFIPHVADEFLANLQFKDTVIGTLPVHLASKVCDTGARFYFLTMDIPVHLRGKELTGNEMHECNVCLLPFKVKQSGKAIAGRV